MDGENQGVVTVGTASVAVLPPRYGQVKRSDYVLTNTGGVLVYIFRGDTPAVVGQGLPLYPQTHDADSTDAARICWQGAIQAISTGAGTTLAWSERVGGARE